MSSYQTTTSASVSSKWISFHPTTCTYLSVNACVDTNGCFLKQYLRRQQQDHTRYFLTLSVPNFRRHLSAFFYFNKLSLGKTFICKVERLNVKQRRFRWDGSMSRLIWIYVVCKSQSWSPVAVKELNERSNDLGTVLYASSCVVAIHTLQAYTRTRLSHQVLNKSTICSVMNVIVS